jgi:hypothetical protein
MRVARYIRRGHGISHRARIAKDNHAFPITHWMKDFAIDKETLKKLLIPVGKHQTGLYGKRTDFYRMPDLKNEEEARRFKNVFNNTDPAKKKFFEKMNLYRKNTDERKYISVSKFFEEVDRQRNN